MKKVDISDISFPILFKSYLAHSKMTQESFAKKILSTRQYVAKLCKVNIDEIGDAMLFQLYYYFSEELNDAENELSNKKVIELKIFELVLTEINSRTNYSENNKSKPRVRKRK